MSTPAEIDEPRWNSRYQAYYEEGRESGLDVTEAGRYADRRTTEELGADPAATVDVPIAFVTTRFKCPHCHRSRSSKTVTVKHMTRCWYNPAARGCKTCTHYYPGDNGCEGDPGCNCASPEFCNVAGIELDGTLRINCDAWEANGE